MYSYNSTAAPEPTTTEVVLPPASEIRRWARENGISVGQRGPVNPTVLARYLQANPQ